MQALINGLTGVGLLIDPKGSTTVVRLDSEPSFASSDGVDVACLGDARNVDGIEVPDAEEALHALSVAHDREESLDLALMLFDSDLSAATRAAAASALNQLLLSWGVREWLEGVLYGAPLPTNADLKGARRHGTDGGSAVSSMIGRLLDLQPVVRRVHHAWSLVCARVLRQEARDAATSLAARGGVFRELVFAVEGTAADRFRFVALRALQQMSDYRALIDGLMSELNLDQVKRNRSPRPPQEQSRRSRIRDAEFETLYKYYPLVVGSLTRNVAVNKIRDEHAGKRDAILVSEDNLASLASDLSSPEEEVGKRVDARRLRQAIEKLDYNLRACVLLRMAEFSYSEIGDMLGISQAALKSRLNAARNKLRKLLDEPEGLGWER